MGYIVKLIPENVYFVDDGEGWSTTTDSRQEAIQNGQFDDYDVAKESAECWSGGMVLGETFIIEDV